jgi:autophagy-related protein 2
MFSQTYAWALRRLFKFVLKRALGRVLQNELNLEQLDVALG